MSSARQVGLFSAPAAPAAPPRVATPRPPDPPRAAERKPARSPAPAPAPPEPRPKPPRDGAPGDAAARCVNCTRPPALRVTIRTPNVRYRVNGAPADGPSPVDVCTMACAREWGCSGDEITVVRDWRRER